MRRDKTICRYMTRLLEARQTLRISRVWVGWETGDEIKRKQPGKARCGYMKRNWTKWDKPRQGEDGRNERQQNIGQIGWEEVRQR